MKSLQDFLFIFFNKINYNCYLNFLIQIKKKSKNRPLIKGHVHHIIPKYWFKKNPEFLFFQNCEENLIYLTQEEHLLAHKILYKLKKTPQDLGAIYLLQKKRSEAILQYKRLGAQAVHKIQKQNNQTFWNNEWQKQNALKSMAKSNAYETRSKGGKKGGYNRNVNRIITVKDKILFYFNKKPFLCVFNCKTGGDIQRILMKAHATNLKRVSPLLTGKRQSAYGWSCIWLTKKIKN
uniref:HNH homing endonuclease n=1 Tax=Blidingia minima TaxID=63414 RepID=A0A2Z4M9G0_9CHLO|nr:hypothetical protein [Blidingia minima]